MRAQNEFRGATQDAVRRHNLTALFRHVHRNGSTSRAELTRILGLNRSTIAALVDDLVVRGLVEERSTTGRRAPGRPSNVVEIRDDRVAVLAVVLGVDSIDVAAVAPGAKVVRRTQVLLDTEDARSFDRVLEEVTRQARSIHSSLGPHSSLTGVGVAVPGVVRREDGMVHLAPNLGWRDVPLGAELRARLETDLGLVLPVLCSNDANLGALAEHVRGVGSTATNLVYVYTEVGVGGGIVVDGRLVEGSHGYGGEVGHMKVNPQGALCRCGSRGCWETEIGEDALVRLAGRAPGGRQVVDQVLAAAAAGDAQANEAVHQVARWVGIGLANLVNCLNPDVVVLAGLLAELLETCSEEIQAEMSSSLVTPAHLAVRLVPASLGSESVLLGAAEIALEPIISDPGSLAPLEPSVSGR